MRPEIEQLATEIFLKHRQDPASPQGYILPDTFIYVTVLHDDEGCRFTFKYSCAFWFVHGGLRYLAIVPEHHDMIVMESSDITLSCIWELLDNPEDWKAADIPEWN